MKIQNIVSDVRKRVETAGKNYQGAFKAYVTAQSKAVTIVTHNGQSLAHTEIGAAKNIYASAKASFERARNDGLREVANNPQSYVPRGRAQVVSAYKTTIDLLVKTGNELGDVVTNGYKSVVDTLSGKVASKQPAERKTTASDKPAPAKPASTSTARKTPSSRTKTAGSNTAKQSATRTPSQSPSKTKATATKKKSPSANKKAATGTASADNTTAS